MSQTKKTDRPPEAMPDQLREIVKSGCVLALPQSAARILELSKNPENGPAEYEIPIVADPGLAAQILRFANSSFFGFTHKITTVRTALTLVSIRTIRNFVLWNAVFSLLPNPGTGAFQLRRFHQDALRRAVFCKVFADRCGGVDSEQLFVSGLFQDIALPILVKKLPEDYADIFGRQASTGGRLSSLEENRFGWNHAQAGEFFVREWGLGEEVAENVVCHAQETETKEMDTLEKIARAMVRLSGLLPGVGDYPNWEDADRFFSLQRIVNIQVRNMLGAPLLSPATLFEETDTQFTDMLNVAQIRGPRHSLRDCLGAYFQPSDEKNSA